MVADFSGYATKNGLKCSDGRTIMAGAFKHNDGVTVPLVWQHQHNEPSNILGHAVLENRADGVYAYGYFNGSPGGENAKTLVKHKDITALSIYATGLTEQGKSVLHGEIREVSLVLSGANPGAFIDNVNLMHSDGNYETVDDEAIIYTGLDLEHEDEVIHAAMPVADKSIAEIFDGMTEEQKNTVYFMLSEVADGSTSKNTTVQHAASTMAAHNMALIGAVKNKDTKAMAAAGNAMMTASKSNTSKAMVDARAAMSKAIDSNDPNAMMDARKAMMASHDAGSIMHDAEAEETPVVENNVTNSETIVEEVVEPEPEPEAEVSVEEVPEVVPPENVADTTDDAIQHNQEDTNMTRNVFEQNGTPTATRSTLTHAQIGTIITDAQKNGSFKESFLAHAVEYGIENIDYLFPDAQSVTAVPDVIGRRQEWVASIFGGAKHSPFSRIKSTAVDLTADQARAKGYVKASLKKDEVIKLLKRVTTPTTIYKKQKLDRDDIIDITDLDVVSWLKAEMRVMLDEEVARAVLIGDGREPDDADKINEDCIRPIAFDDEMYAHQVTVASDISGESIIEAILRSRTYYKGTGTPTLYTTDSVLTDLILLKDKVGRRLYMTETELAAGLRVKDIVVVEVMESVPDLLAVIVNIADYTMGADKGGQIGMFDDFDIDYNQYKYLIETRMSGALTKPKSAVVVKRTSGSVVSPVVPTYNPATHTITIPTTAGVLYQVLGVTQTAGALVITETTEVTAVPAPLYSFPHNIDTDWTYIYTA